MSWTTPKTFTAESSPTVADFNTYLRDNSNMLAAAQATEAGHLLTTDGLNEVRWREPKTSTETATVSTNSTTPTTLGSSTPNVTVEHSGAILVLFAARMRLTAGTNVMYCAPRVDGEVDFAATTVRAIQTQEGGFVRIGAELIYYGLTAGTDTLTLMYWVDNSASTGEYGDRTITAIPL